METNPDQWYGLFNAPIKYVTSGKVLVFELVKDASIIGCYTLCKSNQECKTWTWKPEQKTCSLNTYKPTRKIDIGNLGIQPPPFLFSGCMPGRTDCPT